MASKNVDRVYIFDTTLRDGEQCPGASMNIREKIEVAKQLARLKVDVIEAGFPISSPGDFEGVKLVAKEIEGPSIAGLARATQKDIKACYDAVKYSKRPRIHTFIATSPIHMEKKLCKTPPQVLKMAVEAVKYARGLCKDVEFSCEDFGRSKNDFIVEIVTAVIEAGATTINLPDTVGYCIPDEFGAKVGEIIRRVPNANKAVFSVHCHNDLGMAVANSLSAVQNGVRQIECTINGIGERAGNCSLEEIVMALKVRKNYFECDTEINTKEIYKASKLVSTLTGMVVQPNKAIVGANAFAHESGIHQDGMLKHPETYEIMTPQQVGVPKTTLVLGKHSGRHALGKRMAELGFELDSADLEKAYERFKVLADKKKEIFDEDLATIVEDEVYKMPEIYRLTHLQAVSGSNVHPTSTVTIAVKGKEQTDSASGDGPVDAAFKAIERVAGVEGELKDYSLRAISKGKDALGEVTVQVAWEGNERSTAGRGASTDIIEASGLAYVNSLNRYCAQKAANAKKNRSDKAKKSAGKSAAKSGSKK